jgi:hypothetical protein
MATDLFRAGHRGRPDGAVCNLFSDGSRRHHCPATASACRRLCEDVQPRLNCIAESVRNKFSLEEMTIDAAVHDQAIEQDETRAIVAHSSPSPGDAPTRQTSELDEIARRVSEVNPNTKPIISSRDELLRIDRRSFGAARLHSQPFVSVTVKSGLIAGSAGDRVRCRLSLAPLAKSRWPLCRIRNRRSSFLSQGLCAATTAVLGTTRVQ